MSERHINKKQVRIALADGKKLIGSINLGRYNRISDFLNSDITFIPLFDIESSAMKEVVIINKEQIVYVEEYLV